MVLGTKTRGKNRASSAPNCCLRSAEAVGKGVAGQEAIAAAPWASQSIMLDPGVRPHGAALPQNPAEPQSRLHLQLPPPQLGKGAPTPGDTHAEPWQDPGVRK